MRLKFQCPKCKKEFYADDRATVVCPKCGTYVKKKK